MSGHSWYLLNEEISFVFVFPFFGVNFALHFQSSSLRCCLVAGVQKGKESEFGREPYRPPFASLALLSRPKCPSAFFSTPVKQARNIHPSLIKVLGKRCLSSRGRKPVRRLHWAVESVSNEDGDVNENGEKPMGLDWPNNSSHAARFFVHFLPSLHDDDVRTWIQVNDFVFLFLNFGRVFQLLKKLPTFDEFTELE